MLRTDAPALTPMQSGLVTFTVGLGLLIPPRLDYSRLVFRRRGNGPAVTLAPRHNISMRRLALISTRTVLACTVLPLCAQFSSMSSDFTGSRLFFSTELSQTGAGQPNHGKVFTADANGIRPLLIHNRDIVSTGAGLFANAFITNFYNIDGVDVSSDGAHLSIAALRECSGFTSGLCGYAAATSLFNNRGEIVLAAPGRLALSPSGKWALGVAGPLTSAETRLTIYNLVTGVQYPIVAPSHPNRDWLRHGIADDGTAIVSGYDVLLLFRVPDFRQSLPVKSGLSGTGVRSAAIDSSGRVVVWEEAVCALQQCPRADEPLNHSLYVARVSDLSKPVSLQMDGRSDFLPCLSDDGRRILFLSTPTTADDPQVFTIGADGTERRQVTREPEGIASAVLSGNNLVVWAQTRTGRLIRIELDSGRITQLTEPLAAFLRPIYFSNTQVVPSITGSPGQLISVPASVMPGERVTISINGQPAPVLGIQKQVVIFQIPWTASLDGAAPYAIREVGIAKPDAASWSGNTMRLFLYPSVPFSLHTSSGYAVVAHQDFSSLVTPERPARPNEIIHLFAAGLGPVTPAVEDGMLAPSSPLSRIQNPVTCEVSNQNGSLRTPAEVLFVGLAPGLIGVYQLDVRLPDQLPIAQLVCRATGGEFTAQIAVI
jgi:uncharacterized protein (TIGR03437 family)